MTIPDYQTCMLPLLTIAGDGREHSLREATEKISDQFDLTAEKRAQMLPSGGQFVINNRVAWARTYLYKAGLIAMPRRGFIAITDRGRDVLKSRPDKIDVNMLNRYNEFREFRARRKDSDTPGEGSSPTLPYSTPEEALDYGINAINGTLADDLLDRIMACSPAFFERLVIELLVTMGYGGTLQEAGQVVGKSGDGGIDGIIKEDRLGLDQIYVQAKRWEGTVGRPEIQKFAGALLGQKARKGIFITTSTFTRDAVDFAGNVETKIVLIDGQRLAELMIEFGLGVNTVRTVVVRKVDEDWFEG